MSPGRKPRRSPASTAGRVSTMRCTVLRSSASTAQATARKVLPVPAGPMPKLMSCVSMWRRYCSWFGVRAARSARRVCSTMRPASGAAVSGCGWRSACCSASASIGCAAPSYKRCSRASAASAAARSPSMRKRSLRCEMLTPSERSMVRRCSSTAPHRCDRRVLSVGVKAWRRITARAPRSKDRRSGTSAHCRPVIPVHPSGTMLVAMQRPCPPTAARSLSRGLSQWLLCLGLLWLAASGAAAQSVSIHAAQAVVSDSPTFPDRHDGAAGRPARRLVAQPARQQRAGLVSTELHRPGPARTRRPARAVHRACLHQSRGLPERTAGAQRRVR